MEFLGIKCKGKYKKKRKLLQRVSELESESKAYKDALGSSPISVQLA
jgi:hypothetical protein